MKMIGKNERVFKGNHIFYDSNILRETESALLISSISETTDEIYKYWIPKSKVSICIVTDESTIVEVNNEYVKNPNFGMIRNQYFVPMFFMSKNSRESVIESAMLSGSIVDSRHEKCNSLKL